MSANRKFNSIARRIHRSWQWKRLGMILLLNAAALLTCTLAYLYAQETAVTGTFAGWQMPRSFIAPEGVGGLEGLKQLQYTFLWQGTKHVVALEPYVRLVYGFGRVLLALELGMWLLGFLSGARDARRLLKPLNRMAETAQRLTDEAAARPGMAEAKFHDLEHAIEKIDIGDRLSTGDRELRGLEDAINDLLSRMHAAYRQQAQFVSDASHELRTPIAVIQGYANLLSRWGKDDETVLTESIAAIKAETEHMKTLVEQLLFLARGDSGRQKMLPEPLDLAEMTAEVLDEYRMIDETHEWRQGKLSPARALADPALIKQAARILVDNAVCYTPEGESIRLSAGAVKDHVYFEVQDSGIGIAEADLPHIFDRFYRADPARARQSGGTGLGLSIAQWIVERHGGYFVVTSRPGLGTRIRLCLPRQDAPEAAGA